MFFWIGVLILLAAILIWLKWIGRRIDRDYSLAVEDLRFLQISLGLQELGLYETAVFVCSREAR